MRRSVQVVVTPVYEDREASTQLFSELAESVGTQLFIVAVDDGSLYEPLEPSAISEAGMSGVVLRLKRNVGHQRAIAIGLSYVAENLPDAVCVVMDCDGEDVPATFNELTRHLGSDVEVVVASRRSRVESIQFRAFYAAYKFIFRLLSGRQISFGNYMALKPSAVKRLTAMQELWTHIAATVLVSKLRLYICPVDRGPRYAGKSKMNFPGLVLHGFRALMIFAEDMLVRVGIACIVLAGLSVLGVGISTLLKLSGFATPGWFSVALGILLLVLLQTGLLALVTLMLTGILRTSSVLSTNYREFIDAVLETPRKSR